MQCLFMLLGASSFPADAVLPKSFLTDLRTVGFCYKRAAETKNHEHAQAFAIDAAAGDREVDVSSRSQTSVAPSRSPTPLTVITPVSG